MGIWFNVTGARRKELVDIISEAIRMKAIYKFMPTCVYGILLKNLTGSLAFRNGGAGHEISG